MAWIAWQKRILLVAVGWENWLFRRINGVNSKIEQIGKDHYGMTNLFFNFGNRRAWTVKFVIFAKTEKQRWISLLERKTANDINVWRTLRVVTIVHLQSLTSNSREIGGLLRRSATFPDCQEDSSSTGFENPEESWKRQQTLVLTTFSFQDSL